MGRHTGAWPWETPAMQRKSTDHAARAGDPAEAVDLRGPDQGGLDPAQVDGLTDVNATAFRAMPMTDARCILLPSV